MIFTLQNEIYKRPTLFQRKGLDFWDNEDTFGAEDCRFCDGLSFNSQSDPNSCNVVFFCISYLCIGGCDAEETACHLFSSCATFGRVWLLVLQWLGISFVATYRVRDHFHQFSHIARLPRFTHSFMTLLLLACVWVIQKERNSRVFNQKALDLHQITDNIKQVSYQWLKASLTTFAYNYTDWRRHSLSCMGVKL